MLTLALLVLAAAPKPVELPEKVAVFAAGEDPAAKIVAGRVEVELAKALKKKGVTLLDIEGQFPPPQPESGEEGDKLFTQGKEAYDNLDFDAAGKALSQAALFFIKRPNAAQPEKLAEIFLFLGASELQNGAKAEAQKDFTRALQIHPTLIPDNKYFGSDVQQAFTAAQKAIGSLPKGKLTVDSNPSGAEVQAFGDSYGMTPVSEVELPAGRYLVQLSRPGYAPSIAFPEVVAKQTVAVNQTLQGGALYMIVHDQALLLISRGNFDGSTLPKGGAETGKDLQARYLVLASVASEGKGSKVELQVWNVTSGDRLKGVKFAADDAGYEAGAEAVKGWIANPTAVAAADGEGEGGDDEVQPSGGGGVLKQWWFWTAVGVVVVGAGVTTGIVVSQPHGPGGFNTALGQP